MNVPFDFGSFIETAGTIAALLGVIASIWLARSGQKQDLGLAKDEADRAERAQAASEASAERAEATSRITVDQMDRIADALDEIATSRLRGVGVMLPMPKVSWKLEHHAGDTYLLTNVGGADAFDVQITSHESLMHESEWVSTEQIRPGEAATFMAARTFDTSDSTISVRWSAKPGGERGIWRYPLPPRPPRP